MEDLLPENDLDLFKEYFEFLDKINASRHYELYKNTGMEDISKKSKC